MRGTEGVRVDPFHEFVVALDDGRILAATVDNAVFVATETLEIIFRPEQQKMVPDSW